MSVKHVFGFIIWKSGLVQDIYWTITRETLTES